MLTIKSITASVSVILAVYGCLSLLHPSGNMERSFNRIIGIILISVMLIPLLKSGSILSDIGNYFNSSEKSKMNYGIDLNAIYLDEIEKSLELKLSEMIRQKGITDFKLSVFTDISDEGDIFIDRVLVTCPENEKQEIKEILDTVGIETSFE